MNLYLNFDVTRGIFSHEEEYNIFSRQVSIDLIVRLVNFVSKSC